MINNSNKLNWNLMKNNSMQQKKIYRGINNLRKVKKNLECRI